MLGQTFGLQISNYDIPVILSLNLPVEILKLLKILHFIALVRTSGPYHRQQ